MFDVLLASNRLADGVLAADLKAAAGREFYDDGYFDVFAKEQFGVLQRRLNDSITAVASMIIGAWEQAGRPASCRPTRRASRVQLSGRPLGASARAVAAAVLPDMDVYLIPTTTPERYELYYEAPDEEVVEAGNGTGFIDRMKQRFAEMLREAEEWRHRRHERRPARSACSPAAPQGHGLRGRAHRRAAAAVAHAESATRSAR